MIRTDAAATGMDCARRVGEIAGLKAALADCEAEELELSGSIKKGKA